MPQIPPVPLTATVNCDSEGTVTPSECAQTGVDFTLPLGSQLRKASVKLGVILGATFLGSLTTVTAQDVPGASWSNYGWGVNGGAAYSPYYDPQAGVGISIGAPAANGSMLAQPTPAGMMPSPQGAQYVDPNAANPAVMTGPGSVSAYGSTVPATAFPSQSFAAQNMTFPSSATQGRLPSPALPGPTYQSGYASGAKYFQPGGYDARLGSPYYYDGNERSSLSGDPYVDHFGPGFHRNQVHGHYRFPYYTYRAPWYYPGRAVYNRDTNYAW